MAHTRIKICGVTCPADAGAVGAAGADAIGLVFHPASPRAVGIEAARAIVAALPFMVVMLLMMWSVFGAMRYELRWEQ